MRWFLPSSLLAFLLVPGACSHYESLQDEPALTRGNRRLIAYTSDRALRADLKRMREWASLASRVRLERHRAAVASNESSAMDVTVAAPMLASSETATAVAFSAAPVEEVRISGAASDESITNNQELAVDEGDIVKRHGNHLVLLRRGRLFTFDMGAGPGAPLRAVDRADVFPFTYSHDAWYDELLIHDDTLIVTGYNFSIGLTELALFHIDQWGRIEHAQTYVADSFDYYSSENYASRLVDGQLIFYIPIAAIHSIERGGPIWPTYSTLGPEGMDENLRPLFDAPTIYRPLQNSSFPIIHTIVRCSIEADDLACAADGFVGPWASTSYVSRDAVYLWVGSQGWAFDLWTMDSQTFGRLVERGDHDRWIEEEVSLLYRLPIDGGRPGVVQIEGEPADQLSFRERGDALQVLLESWQGIAEIDMAWIEIALDRFIAEVIPLGKGEYHGLPALDHWCRVHRFVGDYVLYGFCRETSEGASHGGVIAQNLVVDAPPQSIYLGYAPDRIEPMGEDALVVGRAGVRPDLSLELTTLFLDFEARVAGWKSIARSVEAESRTHGFNYTARQGGWLFGLPTLEIEVSPEAAAAVDDWAPFEGSTGISFFSMEPDGAIESRGRLEASPGYDQVDDDCDTSCEDWYGSHRPIFTDGRIFALIDYELVEAELRPGSIFELQRASALDAPLRVSRSSAEPGD